MHLTFLGTGTSTGVPAPGCDCPTCRSADPRDRRRRCSIWLRAPDFGLLVDTTPDLHEQCLRHGVDRIDAVLITHAHADHINGLDDLRVFASRRVDGPLPVFVHPPSLARLRSHFDYVVEQPVPGVHLPRLRLQALPDPVFEVGPFTVDWRTVEHGSLPSAAFLLGGFARPVAYVPDCKRLLPEQEAWLGRADTVILDALRDREHASHLSLSESLAHVARIRPRRAWFTHIGHELAHAATQPRLPAGVDLAFDGLRLRLS